MQLQEEPAPTGQRAVKSSAVVVPEGSLELPAPQASHATASSTPTPANMPAQPPRQTLALANCGPLIRPGALDEAYTALGRIRADLQDADRCLARERLGLISGWLQAHTATKTA